MKIVTHNGHFHVDDLLAVAALLLKYPDAEVVRSRDLEIINSADIVVDVGLIYDSKTMRFDHHQVSGAGERQNGIPYASFGLVWKHFGEELAGGVDEAKVLEEKLVMSVDAKDNGLELYIPKYDRVREYSVGEFFESFAKGIQKPEEVDASFFCALDIAKGLLKREIRSARHSIASWQEVKRIYDQSENKKVVVLPEGLRWKQVLVPTEAVYVVSPRSDGQWFVRAVPKDVDDLELKKDLPTSWAGLSDEALQGVTREASAVFCHRNRWLCVTKTKEGALRLAETALNS